MLVFTFCSVALSFFIIIAFKTFEQLTIIFREMHSSTPNLPNYFDVLPGDEHKLGPLLKIAILGSTHLAAQKKPKSLKAQVARTSSFFMFNYKLLLNKH